MTSFRYLFSLFPCLCIVFLLLLAACSNRDASEEANNASTTSQRPWKVICFGDGLTIGPGLDPKEAYPAQLEKMLRGASRAVQVVNAGIQGQTSVQGNERIEWVLQQRFDAFVVNYGYQDGDLPLSSTTSAIADMLRKLRLGTPPELPVVLVVPPRDSEREQQEWNREFRQMATDFNCILLENSLPPASQQAEYWRPNDNLLNEKGHQLLAVRIAEALASHVH